MAQNPSNKQSKKQPKKQPQKQETQLTQRHWQASYGAIPHEINPEAYRSVLEMMEQAMHQYADLPAVRCAGMTLSYADLDIQSLNLAAYLQNTLQVKKGDRIAVMLPNLPAFPIALLAIMRVGAIQVNVNPMYTARELEHQLNDAGAKIILVFNGVSATVAECLSHTQLEQVIHVAPGDGSAMTLPTPPLDSRISKAISLADALQAGADLMLETVHLAPDDLLFLQYTGGTTGVSKGAALSHRNIVANTEQFKAITWDAICPGQEVIVTALPLYHIFALMVNFITYFSLGAENWLVPNPRDLDGLINTLKAARPTVFTGVNTLFAGLVAHPRASEVDWGRLRLSGGGGAAVIRSVSDKWQALTGTCIREGYGLSETSPILSFNPASTTEFNGSTGLPLPSTDIKLLDESDQQVGIGSEGEICAKGPQVMGGYWQQDKANLVAFTADGYFRTGDVGVFDELGFLKIVDRKKDMIIVSGFNVYPNEIEAVVTGIDGVAECACVGIPDTKTGEAIRLFVVRTSVSELTEDDIIAQCRTQLTGYKLPKSICFLDVLPKTTVGKILRRELRDTGKLV